jgi:hypothetical protein
VDWEGKRVSCPQGKRSSSWLEYIEADGEPYVSARFRAADCAACPARDLCTRSKSRGRNVRLPPREQYQALKEMRSFLESEEGRRAYARRSGVEGTISQGVRSFGLRRCRYLGEARARLQHAATAAAMNVSRLSDWFGGVPRAKTRNSQFTRLAA